MKIKLSAFVLSLAVCTHAHALTTRPVEHTCPIGGEKFTSVMVMSGFSIDMKTDLEPVGMVMAPAPIPVCPSNKFVMFNWISMKKSSEARLISSRWLKRPQRKGWRG